jgi:hypothetical protein
MAENKKSFVLYSDSQGLVNQLPDDVAGRLLKHIYAYVNDEKPISNELLLNIAFEPIKMQLKRDLVKWEQTLEGRSKAGKASAEAKKLAKLTQQTLTNSTNVDFVQQSSTNSTDNVNVNVNVNDNVSVINKIESKPSLETRSLAFKETLRPFINKFGVDMVKNFYGYWSEPNQTKTKMLFEMQKTWDTSRRLENWSKRESSFNNKQEVKHNNLGI